MVSLKNRQSGFTIVELLIVIVIIGILATLVIVTFTGIQERARNSERQTDINAIQSQLEAFYANNGYYPNADALNSAAFRANASYDFSLDVEALRAPRGGTTAVTGTAPVAGTTNTYYYEASGCSGNNATDLTAANAALAQCTAFILTANLEGGGNFVKRSN